MSSPPDSLDPSGNPRGNGALPRRVNTRWARDADPQDHPRTPSVPLPPRGEGEGRRSTRSPPNSLGPSPPFGGRRRHRQDHPRTPSFPLPPRGGRGTPPPAVFSLISRRPGWGDERSAGGSGREEGASRPAPSTAIHKITPQLPHSLSPLAGGEGRHRPPVFSLISRRPGWGDERSAWRSGREEGASRALAAASARAVEQPGGPDADANEPRVEPPTVQFARRPFEPRPPGRSRQTPPTGSSAPAGSGLPPRPSPAGSRAASPAPAARSAAPSSPAASGRPAAPAAENPRSGSS